MLRRTALALECLLVALPAGAQDGLLAPNPVVLDAKSASELSLTQTRPDYPPIAKHNYIQGRVRLQVLVMRDGRVRKAHIIFGHPILAASALKAVRRWRYRPFKTPSGPAEFMTLVEMKFALHSKKIDQVPRQPEQDLTRQVRPPETIEKPTPPAGSTSVRLRVLVDDNGRVLDSQPEGGLPSCFDAARSNVEHWTFRPAHWGTLPVPWYLDVDVPVNATTLQHVASDPGGG